jgi:phage anti-repressor protein
MDDYCQTLLEVWLQAALPLHENPQWGLITDLSVDAKQLHMVLGVRKTYNAWFKDHLRRHPWSEGTDYITYHPDGDHAIEVNMAQDLALMTETKLGCAVWRYLVEEKKTFQSQAEPAFFLGEEFVDQLEADIREAGENSKEYPQELEMFIRESLLIYFDIKHLGYLLGIPEYTEASSLVTLCSQCFAHRDFAPSWLDEGYLTFPVLYTTGTVAVRHPRMRDFAFRSPSIETL